MGQIPAYQRKRRAAAIRLRVDALVAISVGIAVIWSAWGLLREAIALSRDAAPRHVDPGPVEAALEALPGVQRVETRQVWGLSTSRAALTAPVHRDPARLEAEGLSRDQLLALARQRLRELGIRKTTLQLESERPA